MIYRNNYGQMYFLQPMGLYRVKGRDHQIMFCFQHTHHYPAIYAVNDNGKIFPFGLKEDVKRLKNNYYPLINNREFEHLYIEFCSSAITKPPIRTIDLIKDILCRECKKKLATKKLKQPNE